MPRVVSAQGVSAQEGSARGGSAWRGVHPPNPEADASPMTIYERAVFLPDLTCKYIICDHITHNINNCCYQCT